MAGPIGKMCAILVFACFDVESTAIARVAGHRLIFLAFAKRKAHALVKLRGFGIKDAQIRRLAAARIMDTLTVRNMLACLEFSLTRVIHAAAANGRNGRWNQDAKGTDGQAEKNVSHVSLPLRLALDSFGPLSTAVNHCW